MDNNAPQGISDAPQDKTPIYWFRATETNYPREDCEIGVHAQTETEARTEAIALWGADHTIHELIDIQHIGVESGE